MRIARCRGQAKDIDRPGDMNAFGISLLANGLVIIIFALELEDVGADAGDDWNPY